MSTVLSVLSSLISDIIAGYFFTKFSPSFTPHTRTNQGLELVTTKEIARIPWVREASEPLEYHSDLITNFCPQKHTYKTTWEHFPHTQGNLEGIGCKVIQYMRESFLMYDFVTDSFRILPFYLQFTQTHWTLELWGKGKSHATVT
jgi:hypothetical protein